MLTTPRPTTTLSPTPLGLLANPWAQKSLTLAQGGIQGLNWLQPVAALGARLYVANVFFSSGLTKLRDWDTTLALFMDE